MNPPGYDVRFSKHGVDCGIIDDPRGRVDLSELMDQGAEEFKAKVYGIQLEDHSPYFVENMGVMVRG